MRMKVKFFTSVALGSGNRRGYPCPPYKITILDEVDSIVEKGDFYLIW